MGAVWSLSKTLSEILDIGALYMDQYMWMEITCKFLHIKAYN